MDVVDVEVSGLARSIRSDDLNTFDQAVMDLSGRLSEGAECFSRQDYVGGADPVDVHKPIAAAQLRRAFDEQLQSAGMRRQARIPPPIFLRVEMAIRSLQDSLRRLRGFTFGTLLRDLSLDRRGTVVYFLAILDLARKGLIVVEQERPYDDIRLERLGPETLSEASPSQA